MSLAFDSRGLLPPGRHTCRGWKPFRAAFAFNHARELQLERLHDFLRNELIPVARGLELTVGGSFVSDKAAPGDIDCVVAIPASAAPRRAELLVVGAAGDKGRIYREYGVEFYLTLLEKGRNDMRAYFEYVGEKSALARGLQAKDLRGTVKVEKWTTL